MHYVTHSQPTISDLALLQETQLGAFFGSVQILTDDRLAITAMAQQVANALKINMFVGPAIGRWVGIYPQGSGQDEKAGRKFAELSDGYVLQLIVHDDEVFAYWLFNQGALSASFWSTPGYFGERNRAGDEKMTGSAEAFRPLIGDAVKLLLPILDRGADQPLFMSEKLEAFAEVLGIANASQSYELIEGEDGLPIDRRNDFEHVSCEPLGAEKTISAPRKDDDARLFLLDGSRKLVACDYAGALVDLDKAVELRPETMMALFLRGSVKHLMGDFAGAILDQTRAIGLSPDKASAYEMRGMAKLEIKDLAGALVDINKAIELEPHSASAYSNRGDVLRKQGDLPNALADYDYAIELDRERPKSWNNRGFLKKQMGALRGALSDLNEAIQLGHEPGFFRNRADVKRALNDLKGAMADYDESIRLSPGHGHALNGRALTRSAAGDITGAIADYDLAIEAKPDDPAIWKNRSIARQRTGDLSGALLDVEKAILLGGPKANFVAGRAEVLRLKKDFASALADYDKAIELGLRNAPVLNGRGLVKFALGDMTGSLADFDSAIAAKPSGTQLAAIETNRSVVLKKLEENSKGSKIQRGRESFIHKSFPSKTPDPFAFPAVGTPTEPIAE